MPPNVNASEPNSPAFDAVYKRKCCPLKDRSTSDLVKDDLAAIRAKICLSCASAELSNWKPVKATAQPSWLLGSPYLVDHQRPCLKSFRIALRSVFRIHSETGNIWSHGFGAILFAYLGLKFFSDDQLLPPSVTLMDKIMTAIWFLGQISCCSLSTIYHTFNCVSQQVGTKLVQCDYIGIFASVWSTLITAGYFGYYCDAGWRSAWYALSMVVAIIGPHLVLTENNLYRVLIYAGVVVPNISAFYHSLVDISLYHPHLVSSVIWCLLGTYGLPLIGAALYLTKVPERFYPGKFDLIGHSHQLMHLLVLWCMYSQYQLLLIGTTIRFNGNCDK
ncbi:Adiponectin receptor protein [Halotydeus destructor]|nr:Adiponectin receptor protein [Halotydeus destructor]